MPLHPRAAEDRDDQAAVAPGLSGGGYLAQHSLLDQLPGLAADGAPKPICPAVFV